MPFLMNYEKKKIPTGDGGTMATVAEMKKLIEEGSEDPVIRHYAAKAVEDCPDRDYLSEMKTLFYWIKRNFRFLSDTDKRELLHEPRLILRQGHGDCDDFVILSAAMLKAIGHPARIALTASNPKHKHLYSHVYTEVLDRNSGTWHGFDPSVPDAKFGWKPSRVYRKSHIALE